MKRSIILAAMTMFAAVAVPAAVGEPGEPGDGIVEGTINVGCSHPASQVRVLAQPAVSGLPTLTATVSSSGSYRILGLGRSRYTVSAQLTNVPEDCRYGRWRPGSRSVTMPLTGVPVVRGIDFRYQPPSTITPIPGTQVAEWLSNRFGDLRLHLDNYGPDAGSWAQLLGRRIEFPLPPYVRDIQKCQYCPDLGDATFYVDDVTMRQHAISWANGRLLLDAWFESDGLEIVGKGSNWAVDRVVPDAHVDDAHVRVPLTLEVDREGLLRFRALDSQFTANLQLVGGCEVLEVNVCPSIDELLERLGRKVRNRVGQLAQPTEFDARVQISALIQLMVNELGNRGGIDAIRNEPQSIVLIDYPG